MAVPQTVIFGWPSTNASIPANWTRETALDTYHLHIATGEDTAGTTGGSASHTHSVTNAVHTVTGGAASVGATYFGGFTKGVTSSVTHSHAASNSASANFTSGATANNPTWVSVIFIKPSDALRPGIPSGAWCLSDSDIFAGWSRVASGKFVKGADAGGDADLIGGGNTNHTHDLSHSHAAANSSAGDSGLFLDSGTGHAAGSHIHSVSLNSASLTSSADDSYPLYYRLLWCQNNTGGDDLPTDAIGIFLGLHGDIPPGWVSPDVMESGYDFIAGAANAGAIGLTGGNRQHDHGGAQTAHNHVANAGFSTTTNGTLTAGLLSRSSAVHTHTWTIGTAQDTVANDTSKAHYPPYMEILLVRWSGAVPATLPPTRMLTGMGL